MATQEGKSTIQGIIGKPPSKRDMDMAGEGEDSGTAGAMSGMTTHVSIMSACKQWEHNKNGE